METRTIEQVKIWKLVLNGVMHRFEEAHVVAICYDEQILKNWYENLKVEPYEDGRYYKVFEKGSALEWYNPFEHGSNEFCGIKYEWVEHEVVDNCGISLVQ